MNEFRRLFVEREFGPADILKCFTRNPAKRIKVDHRKGSLEEGNDGDLIVFDSDWNIDRVYARGELMVSAGKPVIKGTFE